MKFLNFLLTIFIISISLTRSYGQGCSDAGVCTLNSIKNNTEDSTEFLNQLSLGLSYGKGDFSILYLSHYLEYSRTINERLDITGRITFLNINGELSKVNGFSDLFLTGNYKIVSNFKLLGGVKIPFNNANRKYQGLQLPMQYQTSLGTFDLLAGLSFSRKKFGITTAIQIPITQNGNGFLAEQFPINGLERKYPSTNRYIRQSDIILRTSYTIELFKRKIQLAPTLLPIYHLADDLYTNSAGQKTTLRGSMGLTLNALMVVRYSVSPKSFFELSYGKPFITRDLRPDGLTRHFVVSGEYKLKF